MLKDLMSQFYAERSGSQVDILCAARRPVPEDVNISTRSSMNNLGTDYQLDYAGKKNPVVPSIGSDLWKRLKRVSIPTFTGNKSSI